MNGNRRPQADSGEVQDQSRKYEDPRGAHVVDEQRTHKPSDSSTPAIKARKPTSGTYREKRGTADASDSETDGRIQRRSEQE